MINEAEKAFANEQEVISALKKDYTAYEQYLGMNDEWQKRFMDFCLGKKTLPMLYDGFFKRIFHTDVHNDRVSSLISSIIGEKVKVCKILPMQDSFIEGGRMVVLDMLVESEDGSLSNVEVQKNPYRFPGERISCYSSDLVMRQYSRVKGERGKKFLYSDMKKVYTIVIYEETKGVFKEKNMNYIHRGKVVFDTGLKLELLQEFYLVALDTFKNVSYDEYDSNDTLCGWLSFLITENLEDAKRLIEIYPWLEEIYKEIASYKDKPKEVLTMFSQALREIDRNTMQYMIDELDKDVEEKKLIIGEKNKEIEKQNEKLKEQDKEIEKQNEKLKEQDKEIEAKDREIERLKKLLEEKV